MALAGLFTISFFFLILRQAQDDRKKDAVAIPNAASPVCKQIL